MDRKDQKYGKFHLVNEMFDTVDVIRNFKAERVSEAFKVQKDSRIMLTGEGSSRIFPARNIIHHRLMIGKGPELLTEGSLQLEEYPLGNHIVIGASNSGKTKEIIDLFSFLTQKAHHPLYGVTCHDHTPLVRLSDSSIVLENCSEKAVAATKSVIAQALVYECMLQNLIGYEFSLGKLAQSFESILNQKVSAEITSSLVKAGMVYYAGNNTGAAEELSLKTCEIIRKKSSFLPGTFLLHGIEEVVTSGDVMVLVDPLESEYDKIYEIYVKKIGCTVIAFTGKPSPFLNLPLPAHETFYDGYLKLAAGWNMMVEAGIELGIELDKTQRARKIGNETSLT